MRIFSCFLVLLLIAGCMSKKQSFEKENELVISVVREREGFENLSAELLAEGPDGSLEFAVWEEPRVPGGVRYVTIVDSKVVRYGRGK